MPAFFIPFAESPAQAERVYGTFLKNSAGYELSHPTARLFRISFQYWKKLCVAEVGKNITFWPEEAGEVLAIIETRQLVYVHTVLRGGRSASPILVSPDEVAERLYFSDFPARA